MLQLKKLIGLGSLVKTDQGEGFVIGRTTDPKQPNYGIRLMDGSLCAMYPVTSEYPHKPCHTVELIDTNPVDHPQISAGLRDYLIAKQNGTLRVIKERPPIVSPRPTPLPAWYVGIFKAKVAAAAA
jgi:hypothetical protein